MVDLPEIVVTPSQPDQPTVISTPAPDAPVGPPKLELGQSGPTQPKAADVPQRQPGEPGYDPYAKDADTQQSQRRRAYCRVTLNGRDISALVEPFLISLRIADGATDYRCELELDDRDGRLDIPAIGTGSKMTASIGWELESIYKNFDGNVDDVEHSGSRDTGRHMTVRGNGHNPTNKLKQPTNNYLGAGAPPGQEIGLPIPFMQMAQKVIGAAGGSVSMHPKMAAMKSDYWRR